MPGDRPPSALEKVKYLNRESHRYTHTDKEAIHTSLPHRDSITMHASDPYARVPVARLAIECRKFFNHLFLQTILPTSLSILRLHPVLCSVWACQYRLSQITLPFNNLV